MKRIKHLVIATLLATTLIGLGTKTVRADGFYNCYTIWWYTECYWIDLSLMTADQDSVGFEAMYRLCQSLGLCP